MEKRHNSVAGSDEFYSLCSGERSSQETQVAVGFSLTRLIQSYRKQQNIKRHSFTKLSEQIYIDPIQYAQTIEKRSFVQTRCEHTGEGLDGP